MTLSHTQASSIFIKFNKKITMNIFSLRKSMNKQTNEMKSKRKEKEIQCRMMETIFKKKTNKFFSSSWTTVPVQIN